MVLLEDLPQPPKVGDGAGEPVQPIDHDLLDQALLHVLHQPLEGGAVGVFAGKTPVLIDPDRFGGLPAAQVDLPLDGEAVRLFHRLPGVNGVQNGPLLSGICSVSLGGAGGFSLGLAPAAQAVQAGAVQLEQNGFTLLLRRMEQRVDMDDAHRPSSFYMTGRCQWLTYA